MFTDLELREMLRSVDAEASPDPIFEARLLSALSIARTRRRSRAIGWPIALHAPYGRPAFAWAVVLLLLAGLVVVALAGALRRPSLVDAPTPAPSASGEPIDVAQLHVGFSVALPDPPDTIAADPGGGVWELSGGEVRRVLLATRKAAEPLDLGGKPASGLVLRKNLMWVASRDGDVVYELDAVTGQVLASVDVLAPAAIALDESRVLTGPGGRVAGQTPAPLRGPGVLVASATLGTVAEYDSETLTEQWHQAVPGTPILVSEGGGRIWVAARPSDDPSALVLAAYKAGSGEVVGSVRLHAAWPAPRSIAVQESQLGVGNAWIPDPSTGSLTVIDAGAAKVLRTVAVGLGVREIALRPGGAFVVTYATDPARPDVANALAVVNPVTDRIARYIVRSDDPGSGEGIVGLSFEDEADEGKSKLNAPIWTAWFGLDWDGDPSAGRVNTFELP